MRYVSLGLLLFAFWLALSGHYTVFLIAIGALCTLFCILVARRANAVDVEGQPIHLFFGTLTYYPWLLWEIAKSGWTVTRIILHPRLPISPTLTKVRASQKTAPGIATYANSITLTPGTMTVGIEGYELTVHALIRENAADLKEGGMDRRVSRFEKGL